MDGEGGIIKKTTTYKLDEDRGPLYATSLYFEILSLSKYSFLLT